MGTAAVGDDICVDISREYYRFAALWTTLDAIYAHRIRQQ
jgi:hypothetical protein